MHRYLCGCVHEIAQACRCTLYSLNSKELWLTVFDYLCIYPEYIFPVLYILNSLVLTVKMANNSHGDYKNTASRVECKLHENTLLIMLMWEEKNRGWLCWDTTRMCQNIHTPKHRFKCTYMEIPVYIFQTSNFIQKDKKKKDTHYNNYPTLHSVSKEPKSAIQKLSLTFCILYPLFLNNDNDGIIIIFYVYHS